MFTLTLTPDQPCNWPEITTLLQIWNPASQMLAGFTRDQAQYSTTLPIGEQARLNAIYELQQCLTPYQISFSLEINHDDTHCQA